MGELRLISCDVGDCKATVSPEAPERKEWMVICISYDGAVESFLVCPEHTFLRLEEMRVVKHAEHKLVCR